MKTVTRHQDLLLATGEQSRLADQLTMEMYGFSGDTLMEIAGNRASDLIMAFTDQHLRAERKPYGSNDPAGQQTSADRLTPHILFVCGKGNNAGDAFVIARILMGYGFSVSLLPVFGTGDFSPDARRNFDRLLQLSRETGNEVSVFHKWPGPDPRCDMVVDGIFGTGLERRLKPPVSDVVQQLNRSGLPVVALDIPSGLHSNIGEVLGCAIHADMTIQFGIRKLGCYIGDGPTVSGRRVLARLPFPPVSKQNIHARLLDTQREPEKFLLPEAPGSGRPGDRPVRTRRHKYENGVVHVIGGSTGLTGAPLYAAKAAWGLGMGAVTLTFPSAWSLAMETGAPELIQKPTGGDGAHCFTEDDAKQVLENLDTRPGIVVLGPGIGRGKQTLAFVRMILRGCRHPMIVDADALHAIPGHEQLLSDRNSDNPVILTPHPGELAVLSGKQATTDHERLMQSAAVCERTGCLVLSKGNPVYVHSAACRQHLVTPYDTTVFSRAGFGDTLAGHVAAFMSRTRDPLASCELALLHGHQKIKDVIASGKLFPAPSDII